ncbi:MAG: VCBS repeat-containing protein [Ginsengibacter sp.]
MKILLISSTLLVFVLSSCVSSKDKEDALFTILPSSQTDVDFNNKIVEDDSTNMFVNEYTYMGGGVGVGDFNKDGLQDIFFAGNQVSSKLYINKGNLNFEDATQKAGVSTTSWCTGVSVIDINNDGWPDIYVSVSGRVQGSRRQNLLFINQHNLTFKEEAAEYGLADTSYSTQAAFFDYDKDGRLDVYLLNHTLNDTRPNDIRDNKIDSNAIAGDKLYHNEGQMPGTDHPVFKEVSKQAGIIEDGNGLGVVVSDFNGDGYPDIYVSNDYIRNDLLWLNNKNGTFTNSIASSIRHQSYSSMGTDAADVNNDQLPDIVTLDMQPETNERKKMMYSFLTDQRHQLEKDKGYQPEYIHNMLQLNNGVRKINNKKEPFFSETGEMAGIAETDWSWSILIADLNNDGWKDMHITNGLGRDPTNIDFLEYRYNTNVESGIPDNDPGQRKLFMNHLAGMGAVSLRNYLYINKGGLTFEDDSKTGGIDQTSISNGAAYADLDNDGDLDVITNNINGNAFIMRNNLENEKDTSKKTGYITLKLNGDTLNKGGIGAVAYAYSGAFAQMVEQYPVRGYLSTVDSRFHFGFGNGQPDSIKIIWPDGKMQLIQHPSLNKIINVDYKNATELSQQLQPLSDSLFDEVTEKIKVDFTHKETLFFDYNFQPLLPQKFSQEGPFISKADVNGDGLEDFFIAGAFKQSGKIFLQQHNGTFSSKDLVTGTKYEEDMQSIFFDADGDKDLDLLIAGGSSEFEVNSSFYRPRLYANDGKGNFKLDSTAFSALIRTPSKAIAVADMDGDGDMDIFIGGRVSLGTYPQPPRSYILRNDHGRFTDVTSSVCPALESIGLINAAEWVDIDNDKKPDLIIAADWAPIQIFKNTGAQLIDITIESGLKELPALWRSLAVVDIDHDGDMDIVAGNIGLNNPFHINTKQPAELIAKDFDGNGILEPIFCYYIKDNNGEYQLSSGISRNEWSRQMPSFKKRFEQNSSYAKASMETIFTKEMMDGATTLTCHEARSGYFQNDGKGKFTFHAFPLIAQEAPVNAIACEDVNGDGFTDIIIAGNEYQANIMPGRYDASYGLLLTGNGRGDFNAVPPAKSGLILDGDVKDLKIISVGNQKILLAAINDAPMKAFALKKK